MTPYTVRLAGADNLPAPTRIAAEVRFLTQLEQLLEDPQGVLPAAAMADLASEQHAAVEGLEGVPVARLRWEHACLAASLAGWGPLVPVPGAAFEVVPANPAQAPAATWPTHQAPF